MREKRTIINKYTLVMILSILWLGTTHAQMLEIKSVKVAGGDMIIDYDLVDEDPDHRYTIELYSSADEYIQPLKETEGDIGIDLTVGGNKQVIWHASKELGADYKGKLAFELKGRLYIPFVQLNDFDKINKIKKDKPVQITWAAGRGSDVLTWDLYNSKDELVQTFTNIANVGEYELMIPSDVKAGKGYYFKITDKDNKDDLVITPTFQIANKLPVYLKIAAGAAILAAGYVVIDNVGGGEGTGGPDGPGEIPDPVLAGSND